MTQAMRWGCALLLLFCLAHAESIVPFSPKPETQHKITLNFLRSKPKGIVRDFYIWVFLGQDISKAEADAAHKLVHRHNNQLLGKYFKKKSSSQTPNKTTLGRKTICQRMSLGELLKQDAQCIGYALKLSDASTLPQNKIKEIATKIAKTNPKLSAQMQILASKAPLTTLLKSTPARFAEIFNGVDLSYRVKYLDQKIAPERLESLANQNNSAFSRLLQIIIMNPNYPNLHASLARTTKITAPDSKVLFYLGLNALKLNQKKQAIVYFERSAKKLKDPIMRDRIHFWLYLATGNPAYFQKLAQSGFPSIYALYATQKLKQKQNFNISYDVFDSKPAATSRFDITDPFAWLQMQTTIRKDVTAALPQLRFSNTEPHYALAMRRLHQFRVYYYIRPYKEFFGIYDTDTQALMYAIGLQESFFIPASISHAYALGMMQIMPFNVERIAKKLGETPNMFAMFDPRHNIRYAEFFLRDIRTEFGEPIFVAYAYNGGSGFMRQIKERKDLFRKDNPLDPWFSLEYIPYKETREYGQRVLANYILYQRAFGKDLQVEDVLQRLLR